MTDLGDSFAKEILSTSPFKKTAIYTPSGGQGKSIDVDFGNSFVAVQGIGEAGITSSTPAAICCSVDVEGSARGDTLVIDETTYYVTDVQPDGEGFTLLILSKDA